MMTIECCACGEVIGEKDGEGAEGITSGLHEECALKLLPKHLHAEYLYRKSLEGKDL
jgi:hypothetical protein